MGSLVCRYMPHLKQILPISTRTSSPLVWLEGGDRNKSLLTVEGMEDVLYYTKIKGNTDAVSPFTSVLK